MGTCHLLNPLLLLFAGSIRRESSCKGLFSPALVLSLVVKALTNGFSRGAELGCKQVVLIGLLGVGLGCLGGRSFWLGLFWFTAYLLQMALDSTVMAVDSQCWAVLLCHGFSRGGVTFHHNLCRGSGAHYLELT